MSVNSGRRLGALIYAAVPQQKDPSDIALLWLTFFFTEFKIITSWML